MLWRGETFRSPWEKERRGGKRLRSTVPWEVEGEGEGEEEGVVVVAGGAAAGPGTPLELLAAGWRVLCGFLLGGPHDAAADVDGDVPGAMEGGKGVDGIEA